MGQIQISIDQVGVTELFSKFTNNVPDVGGNVSQNTGGMNVRLDVYIHAVDNSGIVDLRGGNVTPPVLWTQGVIVSVNPIVSFAAAGRNFTVDPAAINIPLQLHGSATVQVTPRNNAWETVLTCTLDAVSINIQQLRQSVVAQVRSVLESVDVSPLPGQQKLPGKVINDLSNLSGSIFDDLAPMLNASVTQLSQRFFPASGFLVLPPIRNMWSVAGVVNVNISNISISINETSIVLTVTFS